MRDDVGQTRIALREEERSKGRDHDKLPDVAGIVQWQYDHHAGFVHSFIKTIRYGALKHEHETWKRVFEIINGKRESCRPGTDAPTMLCESKLLVVTGEENTIVVGKELTEDLEAI